MPERKEGDTPQREHTSKGRGRRSFLKKAALGGLSLGTLAFKPVEAQFERATSPLLGAFPSGRRALEGSEPMGPLSVHPDNPRYFRNPATGEAVYLTGSHVWYNLQDMGPHDPPERFDFEAYLDWLVGRNHNFIRGWRWELLTWNTGSNMRTEQNPTTLFHVAPHPWERTGPGEAIDGEPKFDLSQFDPAYFERLRCRVEAARQRGIYLSIMFFEGWGLQFMPNAWPYHPFHPENNINGIDGDINGDGGGQEVHRLADPEVTALQEAYVRKVVETVGDLDNVLWEISNETYPASTEWQFHMIRFVKDLERERPKQHPVGMVYQHKGGPEQNETLFESPADWISPGGWGGYKVHPPANDGRKVILLDTDHLWGIGGSAEWVWKSFLRGHNPIFMDPYDGVVLGDPTPPKFNPEYAPIRRSLGQTLRYAERLDLAMMHPNTTVSSTGYALVNTGAEYLIYQPDSGLFSVNLVPGEYQFEWFDPKAGQAAGTGTVTAEEGLQRFIAPFRGHAVLYLGRVAQ